MIEEVKKEIQRQLQESKERLSHINARGFVAPNEEQLIVHLKGLLSFIDALEVKEVDLEKELIKWHKEHFKKDGTFIGMSGFYLTNNSQMDIAKHFFELGMAVSNKAQKGEKI